MKKIFVTLSIIVCTRTMGQKQAEFSCYTPNKDTLWLDKNDEMSSITLKIWEDSNETVKPVILLVDSSTLEAHRRRLYPPPKRRRG